MIPPVRLRRSCWWGKQEGPGGQFRISWGLWSRRGEGVSRDRGVVELPIVPDFAADLPLALTLDFAITFTLACNTFLASRSFASTASIR